MDDKVWTQADEEELIQIEAKAAAERNRRERVHGNRRNELTRWIRAEFELQHGDGWGNVSFSDFVEFLGQQPAIHFVIPAQYHDKP